MDTCDGPSVSPFRRRRPGRRLALTVGTGLLVAAVVAVPVVTSAGAATSSGTTMLSLDILPGLPLLTASPAAASTVLHIGVALTEPDARG